MMTGNRRRKPEAGSLGTRKRFCFVIMAAMFTCINIAHAEPIPAQQFVKGEAASIETEYEIGDVAVSDNKVCDFMIKDDRREIYLNPRGVGAATLTIWDSAGKKRDVVPLDVMSADFGGTLKEAEKIFAGTNIRASAEGRRIVLSGEALSKIEMEDVELFARRHAEVVNNVTMSREILGTMSDKIRSEIGTPGINVRDVEGRIVLEGLAFSREAAKRAVEIAKLFDPDVINLIEVKETGRRPGQDDMVRLDVYFMEISKEALKSLGVRWAPGSVPENSGDNGSRSGLAGFGSTMIGFVFNLLPKFRHLNEKGAARVLDQATFMVKSGESADFFNGSQVPYYSGDNVTFKDVGISVHAEPIASGHDVDLVINAALSSPSPIIEAGIDTRKISTSAYVAAGQSVVLASMISSRDVKTLNKRPSNIDASSALFDIGASSDFQTGKSEFVVFLRPVILKKMDDAEKELRKYLSIEEEMIFDRSEDEYLEHVEKNKRVPVERKKKRGKNKWRQN